MYKYVLIFVMLMFSYVASAQVPDPTGNGDDCPEGYVWDGIECCLDGQTCNPTPPGGGGNPDPPNDPPNPNGGGSDPLPVFNLCDWLPWLPGC